MSTNTPTPQRRVRIPIGFGSLLMVIVLTMLTTGIGIYLVYSQYQVVRMGYVIDKDLLEYRREMEIKKRLQLSIASYKHPQAVPVFAQKHLQMKAPSHHDEFIIPDPDATSLTKQGGTP